MEATSLAICFSISPSSSSSSDTSLLFVSAGDDVSNGHSSAASFDSIYLNIQMKSNSNDISYRLKYVVEFSNGVLLFPLDTCDPYTRPV